MKTNKRLEIESTLGKYKNFSECILEKIDCREFGMVVEMLVDYIWDNGNIRSDLNHPKIVSLKFKLVQELHIHNKLNEAMCVNPELVNWGISEITVCKLVDEDSYLRPYMSLPVPFHHVAFWFAGDRRINILFSELEVIESETAS
jgi:hypothetical protein